jgi:hypothetical protein
MIRTFLGLVVVKDAKLRFGFEVTYEFCGAAVLSAAQSWLMP